MQLMHTVSTPRSSETMFRPSNAKYFTPIYVHVNIELIQPNGKPAHPFHHLWPVGFVPFPLTR